MDRATFPLNKEGRGKQLIVLTFFPLFLCVEWLTSDEKVVLNNLCDLKIGNITKGAEDGADRVAIEGLEDANLKS